MTTTTDRRRAGLLFPEDVAEIWTQERRKTEGEDAPAVKVDKVHDFYRWSKPTPPGKTIRNRYEDFPMPYGEATRGRRQPAWYADQEQDLRDWWHERLGGAQAPAAYPEAADRRKDVWKAAGLAA